MVELLSTALYAGYIPIAPGTFGSLWAIPLGYLLSGLRPLSGVTFLAVLIGVSIWLSSKGRDLFGGEDPREVVIDETAGLTLLLYSLPLTSSTILIGFSLFRIFDILKPPPIGWIERLLPGGLGIVMDDVLAALYAFSAFFLLETLFSGLKG